MYFESNGTRLFYVSRGVGIPVVHLHGFPLDHQSILRAMTPIFEEFSPDLFQQWFFDYPGMGKSTAGPSIHNVDDLLAVVLSFIRQVIGNRPMILIGESFGGYVARGIAARLPEQVLGMVLLCPVIHPDRQDRTLGVHSTHYEDLTVKQGVTPEMYKQIKEMLVVITPESAKRFIRDYGQIAASQQTAFIENLGKPENYTFSFDVDSPDIPRPYPTLFLCGKQDDAVGYADGWALFPLYPRGGYIVLNNAGHCLELDQSAFFSDVMIDWLTHSCLQQDAKEG